ncbi:EexN family lipoprotein [Vagococcus sp. WN89Y]|uniref:EexN family lipoprotein n=1 Tax=Vagococcus sp. WN89Y TaxID=3457258 RepID=UPI003FCEC649
MKASKWIIAIVSGLLFLTACDNPKSTQWYKEHQDELKQRYQECKSSGEDSQDCKNAKKARFELNQENAPVPNFN